MINKKYIDVGEFRKLGYLQELNRRFLHPLGLALEITIDKNGNECLGGILDSREDDIGYVFDLNASSADRIDKFRMKHKFIESEISLRSRARINKFGCDSIIEPIPSKGKLWNEKE